MQVLQGLGVDPSSCVQTSVVTFASLRPVDLEVGQLEALLLLQVLRVPGLLQDRPLGLVQGLEVPQVQGQALLEVVQEEVLQVLVPEVPRVVLLEVLQPVVVQLVAVRLAVELQLLAVVQPVVVVPQEV